MLLALDPGTRSPGLALFRDDMQPTRLIAADRCRVDDLDHLADGERWFQTARRLAAWVLPKTPSGLLHIVFERPQWYERAKSKGDPNKLAGLTGVAGNLCGILSAHYFITVASPMPAEWIGQLSKECPVCKSTREARKGTGVKTFAKDCENCHGSAWETPRGRYIRRRLLAEELALVPDQNDAIDAVGLGLYESKRLTPHSTFSNGRDGR